MVLLLVVALAWLIFSILGLIGANSGQVYRVPAIFRLVK